MVSVGCPYVVFFEWKEPRATSHKYVNGSFVLNVDIELRPILVHEKYIPFKAVCRPVIVVQSKPLCPKL